MIVQAITTRVWNGQEIVTQRYYEAYARRSYGLVLVRGNSHLEALARLMRSLYA